MVRPTLLACGLILAACTSAADLVKPVAPPISPSVRADISPLCASERPYGFDGKIETLYSLAAPNDGRPRPTAASLAAACAALKDSVWFKPSAGRLIEDAAEAAWILSAVTSAYRRGEANVRGLDLAQIANHRLLALPQEPTAIDAVFMPSGWCNNKFKAPCLQIMAVSFQEHDLIYSLVLAPDGPDNWRLLEGEVTLIARIKPSPSRTSSR